MFFSIDDRHRLYACRGSALVELTLVSPLLFFLFASVIEYSRTANEFTAIVQAARNGARAAALALADDVPRGVQLCDRAQTAVEGELLLAGLRPADYTIAITPADLASGVPNFVGSPMRSVRVSIFRPARSSLFRVIERLPQIRAEALFYIESQQPFPTGCT